MIRPHIYSPPQTQLKIIHRDEALLLIDKPSGLLSVPGKSHEHADCLETRVKMKFPQALLVHRLDMDTSGLMVFAMTPDTQRNLGRQFEKRVVEKEYIARVEGIVTEDTGKIDLPLIVEWPNRPLQIVDFDLGKPAQTVWRVLVRDSDSTVLSLRPKTGRSHQLRVHMREIGHPMLGDRFYGSESGINAAPRLLLHAYKLDLIHPLTGDRIEFSAPCPFFPRCFWGNISRDFVHRGG